MEGEMPKDPMMLMSFINMKLRDFYPTLDALCDDMDVDRQELENKMAEGNTQTQCNYRKRPLLAVIATEGTFIFFLCKSGVDYSSVSPSNPLSLSRMSTSILRR